MNKNLAAKITLCFMTLLGAFCIVVFVLSLISDKGSDELELFERIARLIGYVLVIAIDVFSVIGAYRAAKRSSPEKSLRIAMRCAFAVVVFLCIHDVLLYLEYGNVLEGTFTMAAFFALDACLLALYPAMYFVRKKNRSHGALRFMLIAAALLWLVYIVGDSLGYPASALTDFDEALIKFAPMCSALISLLFMDTDTKPRAKVR